LLTLRGVPQLYYGDEILMKNFSNPDGKVRMDFPGGWPGDKHNKFTAAGRSKEENEVFNYIRTLARFRKGSSALQTGKLMQYIPQSGIYVYFRYDTKQTVMVVYNSTEKEATTNTDRYDERMNGYHSAINVITGEHISNLKQLSIPAKGVLVLELKK